MHLIRYMCGIFMKDRTNEELRRLVIVQPITTVVVSLPRHMEGMG